MYAMGNVQLFDIETLKSPHATYKRLRDESPVYFARELGVHVVTRYDLLREALRDWTRGRDAERRDLVTLRDAIKTGLDSGPGIPVDHVFAELRARYDDRSRSWRSR